MTTVGYGDVTPMTTLGKFIAAGVGILGLGMVALPAGLLASGFTQKLQQRVSTYETMVERALDAAQSLAGNGIEARVLNVSTVRPLDDEAVLAAARETGAIVTVEEHSVHGGLGSAVAEVVVANHPVPMKLLGFPGVFAPTGSATWILEHFGLDPAGIASAATQVVERRGDGRG